MGNKNSNKVPLKTLLLNYLILLISLFNLSLSQKLCNPDDEQVLLKFKQQLGNPSTLETYWKNTTDCCRNWASGISCNDEGRVISLTIGLIDGVTGPIPPAFGDLPFLQRLDFWNRNLSGPIPRPICKLTNLKTLTIVSTSMSGLIPECLGQLNNLAQITISFNSGITGPIPKSLAQLSSINVLELPSNNLSGPIPTTLGQLQKLGLINVDSNQLTGSIPASLGLIKSIDVIVLSNNRLTGLIPETFGSFPKPVTLQLNGNKLSGLIPESMARVNAYLMDFSSNKLSGDASLLFGRNKTFAQSILLGDNHFKFDFSNVDLPLGLRDLNISHNKIYGSLPKQLGQLPIRSIDVSYNQLCGPIPTGRRLMRFSSVYFDHNKCLCGPPLTSCRS